MNNNKKKISVTFYLKKNSEHKERVDRSIYVTIAFSNTSTKLATGIKVDDPGDYWKKGMFIHPKFADINAELYNIKEKILSYDPKHYRNAEEIKNAYNGQDVLTIPMTIKEALEYGFEEKIKSGDWKVTTSQNRASALIKFESFRFKRKAPNWGVVRNHPNQISRIMMKKFSEWLIDPENGESKSNSKLSANNIIGYLHTMYDQYYYDHIDFSEDLIPNPFKKIKHRINVQDESKKAKKRAIDWKWIESIESISYEDKVDEKLRLICLLLAHTGLSFVELGKPDALELYQGLKGVQLRSQRHKTGKDYMIPCNSKIIDLVKKIDYLPWKHWHEDTLKNARYRYNCFAQLNNFLDKLSEDIGYNKTITPHVFRHTFAMRMINHYRVPIPIVARMLGDKEDMVRKHYGEYTDDTIEDQFESHMINFEKMNKNDRMQLIALK